MKTKAIYYGIILIVLLAACTPGIPAEPTATQVVAISTPTLPPPTPTPVPKAMNICIGQEPDSLFLYSSNRSQAMWSVLEAIYDGPIDTVNYEYQPIILEKIPSLADGDAKIESVSVKPGMDMVDANGNFQTLQKDVPYFPAGCTTAECVKTYEGTGEIQMDQLSVTFKLKSGISWADGVPLTAKDSVYSYTISAASGSMDLLKRTASYSALDELTTEWKGIPGNMDQKYMTRFWTPLPEHLYSGIDMTSLPEDPIAKQKPVGWGAYMITEWVAGDHIQLAKNPFYFRSAEGLPKLDIVNFRFLTDNAQQNIEALLSGECDLVDESTLLEDQITSIKDLVSAGKIKAYQSGSQVWEGVHLGITPSLYESQPKLNNTARPDYFGDIRTRQAISMCINKQKILDEIFGGYSSVQNLYVSASDPTLAAATMPMNYDPDSANSQLDFIGWKDYDNNPATPRVAVNIPGVYLGAPLELDFYTTNAEARKKAAALIAADLAQCQIQVNVHQMAPEELFAPGPDGLLFGRKFDMAEFSWSLSTMPACRYYTTPQITSKSNSWIGINVSGYSSPEFDAACQTAAGTIPGQADYLTRQQAAQAIFASDLPVIPLYQMLRLGISRTDLCGYELDSTSRSGLWNVESIDYGSACQ